MLSQQWFISRSRKPREYKFNSQFSFELSEAVPGIAGCSFNLEGIPKAGTVFATYGNKLETGLDFRY